MLEDIKLERDKLIAVVDNIKGVTNMTDKNKNTGIDNTGRQNSGNYNSGHGNSGHGNSGHGNSGHGNSGHGNSGNYNSGNYNSGYRNSGHGNSGYRNSGNYNSGHCNSGNYNSGNYNSGFFNTDEPNVRMFNKDTGKKRAKINIPFIDISVTQWITDIHMTDTEKKDNPQFHVAGGYLKKRSYKDAWREAWSNLDVHTKQQFLELPNFDANLFLEITGVDVRTGSCAGKIVEIDGKKYKLTEM